MKKEKKTEFNFIHFSFLLLLMMIIWNFFLFNQKQNKQTERNILEKYYTPVHIAIPGNRFFDFFCFSSNCNHQFHHPFFFVLCKINIWNVCFFFQTESKMNDGKIIRVDFCFFFLKFFL